jgi:hypothetical protein
MEQAELPRLPEDYYHLPAAIPKPESRVWISAEKVTANTRVVNSAEDLLKALVGERKRKMPRTQISFITGLAAEHEKAAVHFTDRERANAVSQGVKDLISAWSFFERQMARARYGVSQEDAVIYGRAVCLNLQPNVVFRTQVCRKNVPEQQSCKGRLDTVISYKKLAPLLLVPSIISKEYMRLLEKNVEELIKKSEEIKRAVKRQKRRNDTGEEYRNRYVYVPIKFRPMFAAMYDLVVNQINPEEEPVPFDNIIPRNGVTTSDLLGSIIRTYLLLNGFRQRKLKKTRDDYPPKEDTVFRYGIAANQFVKGNPLFDLVNTPRYRLTRTKTSEDLNPGTDQPTLMELRIEASLPEQQHNDFADLVRELKVLQQDPNQKEKYRAALNYLRTLLVQAGLSGLADQYIEATSPLVGFFGKPAPDEVIIDIENRRVGANDVVLLDNVLHVNSIVFGYTVTVSNLPAIGNEQLVTPTPGYEEYHRGGAAEEAIQDQEQYIQTIAYVEAANKARAKRLFDIMKKNPKLSEEEALRQIAEVSEARRNQLRQENPALNETAITVMMNKEGWAVKPLFIPKPNYASERAAEGFTEAIEQLQDWYDSVNLHTAATRQRNHLRDLNLRRWSPVRDEQLALALTEPGPQSAKQQQAYAVQTTTTGQLPGLPIFTQPTTPALPTTFPQIPAPQGPPVIHQTSEE